MLKNKKISIIGAGNFGCAIMSALQRLNYNNIYLFFDDIDSFQVAKNTNHHRDIPNVSFNNINCIDHFEESINNSEYIFIVVPSIVCEETIVNISKITNNANIIICTKGLCDNVEQPFFSELIHSTMPNAKVATLAGPGFASGIINGSQTLVNIASKDLNFAKKISDLFSGSNLILKISNDILSIQILSIIKNILTLYVGYLQGKQININEIIKKILQFLYDSKELLEFFGGNMSILLEPAGIGDIMLSCFGGESRNYQYGKDLGSSNTKDHNKINQTIESIRNYKLLEQILLKNNIKYNMFFEAIQEMFNKKLT